MEKLVYYKVQNVIGPNFFDKAENIFQLYPGVHLARNY